MSKEAKLSAPAASPGRAHGAGPDQSIEAFSRAVAGGRFEGRIVRFAPFLLIVVVVLVAGRLGPQAAIVVGVVIGLGLVAFSVVWERPYWRAQDVMYGYLHSRHRTWIRDTGGRSPVEDPVAAEVWLGAHQPGTVPQFYRAVAAGATADEHQFQVELARMPDATAADRLLKVFAAEGRRFNRSGTAETGELEALVGQVPSSPLTEDIESWIAIVEAHRRWSSGQRDWLAPLEAERSRAGRRPLRLLQSLRVWLGRLAPIMAFAIGSWFLGSLAVSEAETAAIRPEYQQTTYAIRGDLPALDDQVLVRTLPAVERALSTATRAEERPLDDEAFDDVVSNGLPTLIWETGAIEVARPSDADPHRVYQVEVLLGSDGQTQAVLTFDGPSGPRYLYDIDPAVFAALRKAGGLP